MCFVVVKDVPSILPFLQILIRVIQGFGDEGNGALMWCTRRTGEVCASSAESLCTPGTRPEPTTKAQG